MVIAAMLATTRGTEVKRGYRPYAPDHLPMVDPPEPIRDRVPQSEADYKALRAAEWKRARKNAKRARESMK